MEGGQNTRRPSVPPVFPCAETGAELVDPLHSRGEQTLHLKFRGGPQKKGPRAGSLDVFLRSGSQNPDRGFRFEKTRGFEGAPERRGDFRAERQGVSERAERCCGEALSLC